MKFYICETCGNIVTKVEDKNLPISCCGAPMKELIPNTVDAANEKHVPVFTQEGGKVKVSVGSVPHPMTVEHLISFIALETENGNFQIKHLTADDEPKACFHICEKDKVKNVYAYCNLHGLWKNN